MVTGLLEGHFLMCVSVSLTGPPGAQEPGGAATHLVKSGATVPNPAGASKSSR